MKISISWWKIVAVVLVVYALVAGLLIPLRPGIIRVSPESVATGEEVTLRLYGYNTFFTKGTDQARVWLQYDENSALASSHVRAESDTVLVADFALPHDLPRRENSMLLTAIVDMPHDGYSLLPDAVQLVDRDSISTPTVETAWTSEPIQHLNQHKKLSFPYRNVIYESTRNTFYHVPMWFVLMFLFMASVGYSIAYLKTQRPDFDLRAAVFAEIGLLFGFLGLFSGMIWANYTWGNPWSNDIKQLMTAVALLIYLAYFIVRNSFDEPEKGARLSAVYNIFAFAALVPLLYIVPRMFTSLHPGAQGSPTFGSQDLDNTMRLVFYPAILGWTGIGFWLADLYYRYRTVQARLLQLY